MANIGNLKYFIDHVLVVVNYEISAIITPRKLYPYSCLPFCNLICAIEI